MAYALGIEKLQLADIGAVTAPHLALAHPSPLEARSFGQLGVLLVLHGPETLRHEVALAITETLKDRYYHSNELNPEAAFEAGLGEVNRKLQQLITDGVNGWLPHFAAAAFAVRGDQLILSLVGSVVAQMFRGPRILDLASTPGAERRVNPLKVFASVVVGRISPGDAVLLATPSVLDYYSLEKLKRLITTEAPAETLAAMEEQLAAASKQQSFGAFLLTVRDVQAPAPLAVDERPTSQPQTSMARLIEQEERTASFLSPSFTAAVGKTARGLWVALVNTTRRLVLGRPPKRRLDPDEEVPEAAEIRKRSSPRRRMGTGFLASSWRALEVLGVAIVNGARSIIRAVRGVKPPEPVMVRDHLANLPRRTERKANRTLARFNAWPMQQKLLALVVVVLLVVFAQSIVSLGSARAARLTRTQQEAIVADARAKVDSANAAFTYGDEHAAAQDLADASASLSQLPRRPKVNAAALTALKSDLAAGIDKTQHRVRVDNPAVVTDLGAQLSESPKFLLAIGDTLLAGPTGDGNYARIIRSTNKVTLVDPNAPDAGTATLAAREGTANALLYTDRNQLLRYVATTGTFTPLTPTLPEGMNVKSATTFETRLYLLDVLGNRIVRLTRAGASYGSASNWITDSTVNIRNGTSIAVDGNVYVLRANGAVDLFFQGKPATLALTPLSPALSSPTKLWTDATAKHLYVLDPPTHRLVVFDKQGGLTEQIIFPDTVTMTDFSISESAKEALILSEKKILRVDLAI